MLVILLPADRVEEDGQPLVRPAGWGTGNEAIGENDVHKLVGQCRRHRSISSGKHVDPSQRHVVAGKFDRRCPLGDVGRTAHRGGERGWCVVNVNRAPRRPAGRGPLAVEQIERPRTDCLGMAADGGGPLGGDAMHDHVADRRFASVNVEQGTRNRDRRREQHGRRQTMAGSGRPDAGAASNRGSARREEQHTPHGQRSITHHATPSTRTPNTDRTSRAKRPPNSTRERGERFHAGKRHQPAAPLRARRCRPAREIGTGCP
jgi:hypothetical protein